MVMTMTTLHKTNAQAASAAMPTREECSRKFSGIANSGPTLPTREEYRHGINKMRDEMSCPVLRIKEEDIGQELRDYDWSAQPESPASAIPKRPSVNDYLKKQYQKNMLARYPEFERRTDCDIAQLKRALDQMYVFNAIVVMLLALVLLVGVWQLLSLVI